MRESARARRSRHQRRASVASIGTRLAFSFAQRHLIEQGALRVTVSTLGSVNDSATASSIKTQVIGPETAPAVVFLHGLMGRGKNFLTIAKGLEPEYRSVLVDLPNHGDSVWTETFDYEALADSVAEHLASMDLGDFTLVGHSLGGKVAMVMALRHPDLIARLAVVDIAPTDRTNAGDEFVHLLGSLKALDLDAVSKRADADELLSDPIPSRTIRGFLMQNLRRGDDGFEWQPNLDLLFDSLAKIGGFPASEGLEYDRPVVWIAGGKSDYVTDASNDRMRELFPRARKVTIRESGHWVHSAQPEQFTAILRAFLDAE